MDELNLDENRSGKSGEATEPQQRSHGALSFIAGLVIIALAVTGIVFTVSKISSSYKQKKAAEKQALLASYTDFVIPVLAVDPSVFDDIASAPMSELIEISIWSIISGHMNANNYSYASDSLSIPQTEVEAAFTHYFGTEIAIEHMSVEGYGYEFAYDKASSSYKLPLTGLTPLYTPTVTDVESKTDSVVLTVGCVNSSFWMQGTDGSLSAPSPDKYLRITLRGTEGNYRISAIRATGIPETAFAGSGLITAVPATEALSTAESAAKTTQPGSTAG